ncbi:MAG TPA: FliM/FliN family flagellar motor switch protein, partial [Gammaproteobacteria bacterium]|nr:FliM/FliN family flagellar motor switch protein [Gammaproteobacteria bacterium]
KDNRQFNCVNWRKHRISMSRAQNNNDTVQLVELSELSVSNESGKPVVGRNFGLIKNVKVRVTAQVGSCELSVAELFALTENSILKLDQAPNAPVEVLLDGRVIARGELVVADDRFGVQVRELAQG